MQVDKLSIKSKLVTIAGPPNSGKTTLFNYLSGKNYKTVNYPGSTVEYHRARIEGGDSEIIDLVDTPGIVSLIPNSPDEKVAIRNLLKSPDAGVTEITVITVDASQLARHLFLAKQIISIKRNVILVLTMNDICEHKGFFISSEKLESKLKCKVVKVNGRNGAGVEELKSAIRDFILPKDNQENVIAEYEAKSEDLLCLYKEIENIEKEVLSPLSNRDKNVTEANKKLKIVGSENFALKPDARTLKLDGYLLHKYYGILIFASIMGITFISIFWLAAPLMNFVDYLFSQLADFAGKTIGNNWYGNLISEGIITGAGSVLIFVPQILILFFLLGILEDTGYLARGAMIIDKPLSKIGLNGRSFVPMLSGFACAIPAIMAARTIQNKRERMLTIFIIPLMSCSARLPVYALLLAFLFPDNALMSGVVLSCIYLASITSSLIIAGFVNRFSAKIIGVTDYSSFIMELPSYKFPKFGVVFRNSLSNVNQYMKKAGPIILGFSLLLWLLTNLPYQTTDSKTGNDGNKNVVSASRLENSYAAKIGNFLEPVVRPLGLDWRIGVSLISTLAAREVFVSSVALTLKVTETYDNIQNSIVKEMKNARNMKTGEKIFTTSTVAGLIVFFIFALQCISTIAISKKETGGWRIPMLQVIVFTTLAYLFSYITVNGLKLLGVN